MAAEVEPSMFDAGSAPGVASARDTARGDSASNSGVRARVEALICAVTFAAPDPTEVTDVGEGVGTADTVGVGPPNLPPTPRVPGAREAD